MGFVKSKPLNTLLIPSVLLLWAVVIWRYVGPDIFKKNEGKTIQSSLPIILEKQELESYQLLLDYEDPFLQGYTPKSAKASSYSPPKRNPSIGKIQRIFSKTSKPKLTYQGCVDKENATQKTALIQGGSSQTLHATPLLRRQGHGPGMGSAQPNIGRRLACIEITIDVDMKYLDQRKWDINFKRSCRPSSSLEGFIRIAIE